MPHDYPKELTAAVAAVRAASALCAAVQAQISPEVLEKKDRSPVTVADFGSQALVCKAIRQAFPNDPIIAEEDAGALRETENTELLDRVVANVRSQEPGASADDVCRWIDFGGASEYADRYWTLDPIDGTKGFLRKEQYAVSLALIVDGKITVAALGCPNLPETVDGAGPRGAIFTAVAGQGASVIAHNYDTAQPIKVSDTADPADARFCESVESGHSSHGDSETIASQLNITNPPVRLDSQAKYATVARGEADIYLRLPTRKDYVERIWDHAGGVLVVQEAGGTVTDVLGKGLEFTHGKGLENNKGVIVTNGKLHDAVLAVVEELGIGRD